MNTDVRAILALGWVRLESPFIGPHEEYLFIKYGVPHWRSAYYTPYYFPPRVHEALYFWYFNVVALDGPRPLNTRGDAMTFEDYVREVLPVCADEQ